MKKLLPTNLFQLCLLAMIGLRIALPGPVLLSPPWSLAGILPAAAGLVIMLGAWDQFRRARTNINTFRRPDVLVTWDWYRLSRNPMYLGFLLILAGAGLLLGSLLPWIGVLVFWLASEKVYIPFEEQALTASFGDAYIRYRRSTGRWLTLRPSRVTSRTITG